MNSLPLIESKFQDYVLGEESGMSTEVAGDSEEFRRVRLDIYRDAYRLRLIEVLASDYPVLKSHAGDEWFERAAGEYISTHPSVFRNVRWFGGTLPAFLRRQPGHASQPVLAELAEFEWTLGLAFDSPNQDVVDFTEVASVAPEAWAGLRFEPVASLHVLETATNAVAIWKSASAEQPLVAPGLLDAPVSWAIWRKDLSPYFRSLAHDEAWALAALRTGATFAEICAGLCDWVAEDEAAARAAQLLRGWVDDGWISNLKLS